MVPTIMTIITNITISLVVVLIVLVVQVPTLVTSSVTPNLYGKAMLSSEFDLLPTIFKADNSLGSMLFNIS